MYHPDRVLERLRALLPAARKLLGLDHFLFKRYTIEQSATATAYLNQEFKKTPNYQPKGPELEFIVNERAVCRADFKYWALRYAWIRGRGNRVQRFKPNLAQLIILDLLAELDLRQVEIVLQFLKARRLGVSTIAELLVQHRIQFYPNVTAIIGSSDPAKTDKMSKMLTFSLKRQPQWLRPKSGYLGDKLDDPTKGRYKTGIFYEFSNNSYLGLEHGTQFTDIGRGDDPSVAHLSELADFDDPGSKIDSGLLKAMLPHPNNLCILEGTAAGDEGWWPEKWEWNKQHWGNPYEPARMRPTFLPWFVGYTPDHSASIYPDPTFLRGNPPPTDWQAAERTVDHARKCAAYVQANPLLEKHLGPAWQMPREQMWFYETDKREYETQNKLHLFLREMPADDQEAFAAPLESVFPAEVIDRFRQAIERPLAVFGIRGKHIPERFYPRDSEINTKLPIVTVKASWLSSLPTLAFEFVPLKFFGYSEIDPTGKLFVWEWPEAGRTYGLGCDSGDGLGAKRSDDSVLEMVRKGGRFDNDAQVAEFASPDISGTDLWPWALAMGTFYAVPVNGKLRLPKCVPEINREGGKNLVRLLSQWGWPLDLFHRELRRSATRRAAQAIATPGWNMNPVNRKDMLEWLNTALVNDYLEINSPWFVKQMGQFIKRDDGLWGAAKGRHDDRLFALGMAYYSLYEHDTRNTSPEPFIDRSRVVTDEEKYPVYQDEASLPKLPMPKTFY